MGREDLRNESVLRPYRSSVGIAGALEETLYGRGTRLWCANMKENQSFSFINADQVKPWQSIVAL
jgi:hypothetical protein